MQEITKLMVKQYSLKKLGYDFMGFRLNKSHPLSFHHLIIPKRDCESTGLGKGYFMWNGAILNDVESSHEYLHVIERTDRDLFLYITKQMVEENVSGEIDIEHILLIHNALLSFEREYCSKRTKKGKMLIKRSYLDRVGFRYKRD